MNPPDPSQLRPPSRRTSMDRARPQLDSHPSGPRREKGQILLRQHSAQAYHPGSNVWVPETSPEPGNLRGKVVRWVKGQIIGATNEGPNGSLLLVRTEEGHEHKMRPSELPLQNERDDTVDDLVKSDFLHEPGLLHTLRVRYTLDLIYTYSGEILIAANPHKRLKQLYGPRMMAQYKGVPLGELSPHVYAIAEQAFSAMMIDDQQQAILVSGESGAGKTESAKMVMQYLAQRAGRSQKEKTSMHRQQAAPIEEQVLESNPLLEAFGNAKTVRNDNSSRFGKFTDMHFDVSGNVSGATISTYLLERSRVVNINNPERSYHIFYQLCAGTDSEQKKALGLQGGASSFRYLSKSSTFTLPGVDDSEGLRQTLEAMRIVGLNENEREAVLQTVACVLHLGNIVFTEDDDDAAIPADDSARRALSMASILMQVKEQDLLKALTTRTREVGGEKIFSALNQNAAEVSRDSMAKNMYSKLFDWLVAAINRKISALGKGQAGNHSIGILDIYGFESFKENSFEQLCINLANERLQQQFNQQVFKGEQEEYKLEGIDWSYIEFVDNQDCLDLLEGGPGNPSLAIFPLIDEACRLPKATYEDLAHSLRTRLQPLTRFIAPKRPQHSFGVEHYAGRVTYLTNLIMDKNKDFVIKEHQDLVLGSGSSFLRELFEGGDVVEPVSAKRGGRSAFKLNSVGLQFRKQLHGLMNALNQCQPHYIRCIKPNPESRPGSLTPPYVLEQLRAGGVLEAVRIASAGFPTRKPFRPFAQRYCVLLASGKGNYEPLDMKALEEEEAAKICRQILQATKAEGWQLGKTRVFLRAGQLALLEGARGRRLAQSAIVIQSAFRCMAAKRYLKFMRASVTKIQARWRGILGRKLALQARKAKATITIQSSWRMHKVRRGYLVYRKERAATLIQSFVRMHQERKRFRKATTLGKKQAARAAKEQKRIVAAVCIQKYIRRRLAINLVSRTRKERARWIEMERNNAWLKEELEHWKARFSQEAKRSDELAAENAQLQSELVASKLEVENAVEQGMAKAALIKRSSGGLSQRLVEDLEAAQQAAQAALLTEMESLRKQKATSEERGRRAEESLLAVKDEVRTLRNQCEGLSTKLNAKDVENGRLWEQMRMAATEYQQEFLTKEATIRQLMQQQELEKEHIREDMIRARGIVEADIEALKSEMQGEIDRLQAESSTRFQAQREASEKSVHFSAKILGLNSRISTLQKQVKEAKIREKGLQAEISRVQAENNKLQHTLSLPIGYSQNGVANVLEGTDPASHNRINSVDSQQSIPKDLPTQRSSIFDTMNRLNGNNENNLVSSRQDSQGGANVLDQTQETAISLLDGIILPKKLPALNIQYGSSQVESIDLPVASWLITECLLNWAEIWGSQQAEAAGLKLKESILVASEIELLPYQCYWLVAGLAAGSLVKVQSMGHPNRTGLVRLGDELIENAQLLGYIATSVMEQLPVNINQLFKAPPRTMARAGSVASPRSLASEQSYFEALGSSTWKGLLGSLSNIVETWRSEGAPPPLVKAIVTASLRYVDAELTNALMLRRDCCSTQAVTALQAGLGHVHAWAAYVGPNWCGKADEVDAMLAHAIEATQYILIGKNKGVKQIVAGEYIMDDLRRACPSLTLQQIYKLTEHHHDDWISDDQVEGTGLLLEALKSVVERQESSIANGSPITAQNALFSRQQSSASLSSSWEEEETLLLDPQAAFVLPRKLLNEAAKYFVKAAPTPQQPDGGKSLLSLISSACRQNIQIPRRLRQVPESFGFLM